MKARVGKRYLSNARRIYGRARLSASEHDGKSYIRSGSDRAANGTAIMVGTNPTTISSTFTKAIDVPHCMSSRAADEDPGAKPCVEPRLPLAHCLPLFCGLTPTAQPFSWTAGPDSTGETPEMEASVKSQIPMTVSRVLSNPLLRIAVLRIATDQRTWILVGALAAAGVRVLRRCRERFALEGRTVLITSGARGLGPNPRWHER